MAAPVPIPVTIIAGFLGAGKTTLLNRLLRADHGRRLAVLVNDYGDVNIDTQLLDPAGDDEIIDLPNGCVCCTLARDLVGVIWDLIKIEQPPEHIVLEASGVSSPADIVSILDVPELSSRIIVNSVITLVDSENILKLAKAVMFADKQIISADLLLVNKTDLVDEDELTAVLDWIAEVAPDARLIKTQYAQVPLELILGSGQIDHVNHASLTEAGPTARVEGHDFGTWTYTTDQPLSGTALQIAMTTLPAAIIRAKGIVYIAGDPGRRYVLHLVGKRIALTADREWAGSEPGTQLVFIGAVGTFDTADLNARLSACVVS